MVGTLARHWYLCRMMSPEQEEVALTWQIIKYSLLGICAVCYYYGLTQAVASGLFQGRQHFRQALFVVTTPVYGGSGEPPVQRSNLDLITFLCPR